MDFLSLFDIFQYFSGDSVLVPQPHQQQPIAFYRFRCRNSSRAIEHCTQSSQSHELPTDTQITGTMIHHTKKKEKKNHAMAHFTQLALHFPLTNRKKEKHISFSMLTRFHIGFISTVFCRLPSLF